MNQDELPLYSALLRHSHMNPISFHVPGHKNSTVFPALKQNIFKELLKIDQTELRNLDDLHAPIGVIKDAQDLTAALYKVKKSFFLVGGSTAGNLAMILASCEPNDVVFVQRNCHKSITNGLKLAKVRPVFLSPEYDQEGQFSTNVSRETVEQALNKYDNAKALILTSPNYYGIVSKELEQIITYAKAKGLIVLVDEAHGAHLTLGEPFPPSAIHFGADIVVHSAHKTLPAMTMGSFLHFNSHRVDLEKLQYYLQVIQSSSPSYPIMASLDIARYYLAHITEDEKIAIIDSILHFREQLNTVPQLKIVKSDPQSYADPLKVIVQTRCPLTGFELQKRLETESIYTEMADRWNVIFVMPLAPLKNGTTIVEKIKKAVDGLPILAKPRLTLNRNKEEYIFLNEISELALTYGEMKNYSKVRMSVEESIHQISATTIIPYPPGVPLLIEGEKITAGHIEQFISLRKAGAYFQNNDDIWKTGIEVFQRK